MGDYRLPSAMSPTQLSTFLKGRLVRCFLVGRVLREIRSDTLERVQPGAINLNKQTHEGEIALKQMKARMDDLKALVEGVATQTLFSMKK